MSSDKKYALNYFPIQGRAEVARLLFAHAQVKYENNMITYQDWPNQKNDAKRFPLGQLPTLEVDGRVICQSSAIYYYLADEFGMMGTNGADRCLVHQVIEIISDFFKDWYDVYFNKSLDSQEKKDEAYKEFYDKDKTKAGFNHMEQMVKGNPFQSGLFLGDKISLADIFLHFAASNAIDSSFLSKYPLLEAVHQKVSQSPNISEYIASRALTFLP